MPPGWSTLPVHRGLQSHPPRDSIAVYTKNEPDKKLIYEGYICPTAPEMLPVSALQPPPTPPREMAFGMKYALLQEKIRKEQAEAEMQRRISEVVRSREAHCATTSKPDAGVVETEPSTMPCCDDTADGRQIKTEPAESNSNYPFPFEILEQSERLCPSQAYRGREEFEYCFEPWEDIWDGTICDCLCVKEEPSSNG